MNKSFSYVEVTFSEKAKEHFSNLVDKIVPQEQLYKSPVVEFIDGKVTDKLHLTLFYGLDANSSDNQELKDLLGSFEVQELRLGKPFFFSGFQNLYKVFCIEVLDQDLKLKTLSDQIKKLAPIENQRYVFKPHITLAYVQNEFVLPDQPLEFEEVLKVDGVRIASK